MSPHRPTSFVVRVAQDSQGQVSGVVERVATGAKEAFTGLEAIGRVIIQMLLREWARLPTDPDPPSPNAERPREGPPC